MTDWCCSSWRSRRRKSPLILTILLLVPLIHAYSSEDIFYHTGQYHHSDIDGSIEQISVGTDNIEVKWQLNASIESRVTVYRVAVGVLNGPKSSVTAVNLANDGTNEYDFRGLSGNTTYRISVEGFDRARKSISYISKTFHTSLAALEWLPAPSDIMLLEKSDSMIEMSWTMPVLVAHAASKQALVNQHFVTYAEFNAQIRTTSKRMTMSVKMPSTRVRILSLAPETIYNVTIQSGTDNGYGLTAWAVFSTLSVDEKHVLRLKSRTPHTLTIKWLPQWMPDPGATYTIRVKTLHSPTMSTDDANNPNVPPMLIEGYEEEDGGRQPQRTIRDLPAGATFNVSIQDKSSPDRPQLWGVYSTLPTGEFFVTDARLTDETDVAAALVWKPIEYDTAISYQYRFTPNDGGESTIGESMLVGELQCPKYGCEQRWLCAVVLNLARHPRDYSFDIRAYVDGVWNKWTPVVRRSWNINERACSIVPPSYPMENIGNVGTYQTINIRPNDTIADAWRYMLVVDMRPTDSITDINDQSALEDKTTADKSAIGYYVTAALSADEVRRGRIFTIGDGKIYGGYINYPIVKAISAWQLVAISKLPSPHMNGPLDAAAMNDDRAKVCGITQNGEINCEISLDQWTSIVPIWLIAVIIGAIGFVLLVVVVCCVCGCLQTIQKVKSMKASTITDDMDQDGHPVEIIEVDECDKQQEYVLSLNEEQCKRLLRTKEEEDIIRRYISSV